MDKNKMPTIAMRILPSKPDREGLCEVMVRVTINRIPKYYGIGKKIAPDAFDNKAGKAIGRSKAAVELNTLITEEQYRANEAVAEMRKRNERVSFEMFEKYYYRQSTSSIDYYISKAEEKVQPHRIYQYELIKRELKELFGDNITVTDLNLDIINRYEDYMENERGLQKNTRRQRHKIISRIINLAKQDNEYFEENPYSIRKFVMPHEETHRIPLTEDEYIRFVQFRTPSEKLEKIQRQFIFQCNTGLRFCDLNELTRKNIEDDCIVVRQNKTQNIVKVPLTQTAKMILEQLPDMPDHRIFKKISGQKYNDYLAVIAAGAGIDKKVTSHIARYTFATIAMANEIPMDIVGKLLGHQSVETTRIYAKMSTETLKKEMEKVSGVF